MISFLQLEDRLKYILLSIATRRREFDVLRKELQKETGKDILKIDFLAYEKEFSGLSEKVVRVMFFFETNPNPTSIEVVFRRDALAIFGRKYCMDENLVIRRVISYEVVGDSVQKTETKFK